ncbi:MAG: hypothetical protein KF857_05210 [Fimbriimonadaceae bacterium]|nr:hypothetical protein [Fimbriimonadaceae bacterium]
MGGAGSLALLLALVASPRGTGTRPDFDEFKRAQADYVATWVRGKFEELEPFFAPKYVFIRKDSVLARADFIARARNGFNGRMPFEKGEFELKTIVPEMDGYTVDVKRHYVSTTAHLTTGVGELHQYAESMESWIYQSGRWMVSSTKVVSRRAEWHMRDGSVIDVTAGRR